jgi:serine/threonine protein kinase
MAPEIFMDEKYAYGVDIWAIEVTLYYMLNNEYLFST